MTLKPGRTQTINKERRQRNGQTAISKTKAKSMNQNKRTSGSKKKPIKASNSAGLRVL
jgi:hypothetical protein